MNPAIVSQLVTAATKAVEIQFALLDKVLVEPAAQKRQQYLDRLNNALKTLGGRSSSIFDDQINTQKVLMYSMLGLIGLAILAAILKR